MFLGLRAAPPWVLSRDACHVLRLPSCRWINGFLRVGSLSSWDTEPGGVSPELSAPRFFNAPMAEWRKALRCMARAGLITQLSPEIVPLRLSSRAEKHGSRSPDRRQEAVQSSGDDGRLPRPSPSHRSHTLVPPAGFVSQGTQSPLEGNVLPVPGPEITLAEASKGTSGLVRPFARHRV